LLVIIILAGGLTNSIIIILTGGLTNLILKKPAWRLVLPVSRGPMNSTEWIQQKKNRSPGRSGKKSPKCNPGKKSTISDRKKTKKHLEVFERVIGMQFIHNNGEERHSNDHALLCCEGVEMNGDIPAVLTSYVTNLNNSFDQPDPLDIRYVMEQLDPDNKLSGLREKPFNMQRTREQFTDLMERLEKCDPNLNGSPPPSPSTPCDEMGLTGTPLNVKYNSGTPDTGTPPSIPLPTVVPPTPVPPGVTDFLLQLHLIPQLILLCP